MNQLLELFKCATKAELEAQAAETTITQEDLATAILSTKLEGSPLLHTNVFRHFEPPHLKKASEDLKSIRSEDLKVGGPVPPPLLKMVNAIQQQNRKVGHFFWSPEYPWWWVVNFDYRDIKAGVQNHWEHGPHIHMLSWLTHPKTDPNVFLNAMRNDDKPKLPHPIHIRFKQRDQTPFRPTRPKVRPVR